MRLTAFTSVDDPSCFNPEAHKHLSAKKKVKPNGSYHSVQRDKISPVFKLSQNMSKACWTWLRTDSTWTQTDSNHIYVKDAHVHLCFWK